jgi:hypothetical protein
MNKIMLTAATLAVVAGGFVGSAHALRPLPPSHHPSAGFGMTTANSGPQHAKPPKKCPTWNIGCVYYPGGKKKDRPKP